MRIILFLFLIISCSNCFAENAYPVQWTPQLQLKSLQEIPNLLSSKSYADTTVEYIKGNKTATARTCNDYFKLKKENYATKNNAEIAMESFFKDRCDPLMLLINAKPAQTSFLRNFNLKTDYDLLPAGIIFPDLSTIKQKPGNIKALYSDIEIEKNNAEDKFAITLSSHSGSGTSSISLLAWGDFNQDGFDDILISVSNYGYHFEGTYHSYNIYVLTKKAPSDSLVELPVLNKEITA